ncbi:hypothetical protein AAD018_011415 [Aestuariibius insulae]|uniref:hypothetical protein n=1 Tax=Aestuariibius insulae TaxID=2058287 RepID=UPI00345E0829
MKLEWIDQQLKKHNMPRSRLRDAVPGFTDNKISLLFSGDRKLSADEADMIRQFFGYRAPGDSMDPLEEQLQEYLSKLDAHQKRAAVLYLSAVLGDDEAQLQAS